MEKTLPIHNEANVLTESIFSRTIGSNTTQEILEKFRLKARHYIPKFPTLKGRSFIDSVGERDIEPGIVVTELRHFAKRKIKQIMN